MVWSRQTSLKPRAPDDLLSWPQPLPRSGFVSSATDRHRRLSRPWLSARWSPREKERVAVTPIVGRGSCLKIGRGQRSNGRREALPDPEARKLDQISFSPFGLPICAAS